MITSRQPAGYRTFNLPAFLPALECKDATANNSGCALIVTNKDTLIWSQTVDDGYRAVIKMYRRRGAGSRLRGRIFRFRVQREFESLAFLAARAIPCSEPVFWSYGRDSSYGGYEILATREIPDALRMDVFVRSGEQRANRQVLADAYTMLRSLHENGFYHGAMYERNFLVARTDSPETPKVFVIDTPKAVVFPYSIVGTRMVWIDLANLSRSLFHSIGADETAQLLASYEMKDEAIGRFMADLQRYHPNRHTRNRHRAECGLWKLLSRIGIHCPAETSP